MTSAKALRADWKIAKKPASQMMREMVESFIRRSMMDATSRVLILSNELRRTGAAYWALASQMNMLRAKHSARRLATNNQRMEGLRG